MKTKVTSLAAISFAALILLGNSPSSAQSVEEFYKGKTITIIVPFSPGGTTAALGEAVAGTMGRYIPGNPDFKLEFMPGAGGMIGQNYAYNQAPRDGTALFLPQDSTAVIQLTAPETVKFKANEFNWLGVVAQTHHAFCVRKDSGIDSLEDLKEKEAFIGSSGIGSETDFYPRVSKALLNLEKMKIVPGFPGGSTEVMIAVESGEMTGSVNGWQTWARRPDIFEIMNCLIVYGNGRISQIPDTPNLLELVKNDDDKAIVRFLSSVGATGRSVAAPPGVPQDRLDALRAAFMKMLEDPDFMKAMKARSIEIDPIPGAEAQKVIAEAMDASPEVVERTKKIITEE